MLTWTCRNFTSRLKRMLLHKRGNQLVLGNDIFRLRCGRRTPPSAARDWPPPCLGTPVPCHLDPKKTTGSINWVHPNDGSVAGETCSPSQFHPNHGVEAQPSDLLIWDSS